jgi:hypothetical protein
MNPTPLRSNGVRGVESRLIKIRSPDNTPCRRPYAMLPNTPSVVPQQIPWYQTRRPATESVTKVGLKTGVALAAMEDVVPASDYELALCSIGTELALARQTLAAATEKAKTAARAAAAAGISERGHRRRAGCGSLPYRSPLAGQRHGASNSARVRLLARGTRSPETVVTLTVLATSGRRALGYCSEPRKHRRPAPDTAPSSTGLAEDCEQAQHTR